MVLSLINICSQQNLGQIADGGVSQPSLKVNFLHRHGRSIDNCNHSRSHHPVSYTHLDVYKRQGEDSFITVTDTPVPLASFDPPGGLDLIEIEDEPVPLGAFPFVPKMGDMGTGVFVAGMILSFLFGCCALICRNKYTGKEQ